nr:LuxR C-terminal-related transcriptional regulator [uncultured Desulfobacter sp.]
MERFDGTAAYIADYLFSEIVSRLEPQMLSCLMELSVLDRFCAPLGDYIHQGNGLKTVARQCIDQLLKSNLFITPLDHENVWFRFHHLFQDYLKALRRTQWPPDRLAALHHAAAEWFAAQGLVEEAIGHFLKADNCADAVQLILDNRYALMNTSQFNRLSHWLEMLPETVLLDNPLLVSTKAMIGADLGKNVDVHAFTRKANQYLENPSVNQKTAEILSGEVLLLQALVDLIQENIAPGLEKSRQAFSRLPEDAQMPHSISIFIQAVFNQTKGDTPKAVALIQKHLKTFAYTQNTLARIGVSLSTVHLLDANLDGAKKAAQYNLQQTRGLPLYHTRTYAYVHLGIACYLQNDFQAALPALEKAMAHRYVANPTWVTDAGFALVCLHLAQGENDAAARVLAQIKTYGREGNHKRCMELHPAFEIEFLLRQKKVKQALGLASRVDFEVRAPRYFFYTPQITQCKCLIAQGTPAALNQAYERLSELAADMGRIHRTNVQIDLLILLSVACLKQDRSKEALTHLAGALALAEPGKWIRSFPDAGSGLVPVLQHLADNGCRQVFIKQILQAFPGNPGQKFASSQATPASPPPQPLVSVGLTGRETEMIPLLAQGLSNKQIADQLCISAFTVKTHLRNIYRKLGVSSRIEAINKAVR